jgi:hypothetical protein
MQTIPRPSVNTPVLPIDGAIGLELAYEIVQYARRYATPFIQELCSWLEEQSVGPIVRDPFGVERIANSTIKADVDGLCIGSVFTKNSGDAALCTIILMRDGTFCSTKLRPSTKARGGLKRHEHAFFDPFESNLF